MATLGGASGGRSSWERRIGRSIDLCCVRVCGSVIQCGIVCAGIVIFVHRCMAWWSAWQWELCQLFCSPLEVASPWCEIWTLCAAQLGYLDLQYMVVVLILGRREALEWPPLKVRLGVGLRGDGA